MSDLQNRIKRRIWAPQDSQQPRWMADGLRVLRTILTLSRDIAHGRLTLYAMGLVYTTLLSIVPLLALSFSVLKAFGVYHQIQPTLLNFLLPLGEKGEEVARNIVQFIDNTNVGVLGSIGLALLVYTVISLMQKIEESLNYIWHIQRPRPIGERFSRYLSVLMVGPILVFSALGITAALLNIELVRDFLTISLLDRTVQLASRLMPYVLVSAAFTFVYVFIPNTRVRVIPALIGGITGGIAWQTAGWAFAIFVASSGQYAAIYSSLAILILFMIWLYLSWLILLFGADVAFYVQHPEYLYAKGGEPRLSNRMRERLALSVTSLIASRFLAGERAPSMSELARRFGVPMHSLQVLLDAFARQKLVVQSSDDPPVFLPARDPGTITVKAVLKTVRAAGEESFLAPDGLLAPQPVEDVLERIRLAVEASIGDMTIRDLAEQGNEYASAKHDSCGPDDHRVSLPRTGHDTPNAETWK